MRVRLRVKECTAALTPAARRGATVKAAKGVVAIIAARCSQGAELGAKKGCLQTALDIFASRSAEAESRGAFDPTDGRPLHSFYRYSGPLGPAYVGWTDDDQMTWPEGPQIGAATLAWGVVALVTVGTEKYSAEVSR